jgi:hypothetical protein
VHKERLYNGTEELEGTLLVGAIKKLIFLIMPARIFFHLFLGAIILAFTTYEAKVDGGDGWNCDGWSGDEDAEVVEFQQDVAHNEAPDKDGQ